MDRLKLFVSSIAATILVATFATPARADQCDQLTYLTFSAPVALPGVTLPPGTYRFTHPDCGMTSHVLRVSSQDGMKVYATLITIPEARTTPSREPEVIFAEMPVGSPEALKAWFYPGETVGDELVYPKGEARIVADAASQTVLASSGAV
jgi:hypothetical protein